MNFEFMKQEVGNDDIEKEVHLILMVHGIGSNYESQKIREKEMHASFKKIDNKGYFQSDYRIVTHIVNWKQELEKSSSFGKRLKKVTIPSHV